MKLARLQSMIDSKKAYRYRNSAVMFTSYKIDHNEIEIVAVVDGKPQIFLKEDEDKLDLFLNCFSELPTPADQESSLPATVDEPYKGPVIYQESKKQFSDLTKILLDDIEKVRKDPAYVSQAKQISNNINAIVNITKLQLQLLRNG